MVFSITEVVGYLGLALNLISMSVKGEPRLRLLSLVANATYIVYGIMIGAMPIILGSLTAVLLHAYRLIQLNQTYYGQNKIS